MRQRSLRRALEKGNAMTHPNLSPALNAIVAAGEDAGQTLHLGKIEPGKVVTVTMEEKDCRIELCVEIDKPAGEDFNDKASGRLVSCKASTTMQRLFAEDDIDLPKKGDAIAIIGSCTKNPHHPFGMTMVQAHRVTKGRNLCWDLRADSSGPRLVLPEIITDWNILEKKK